MMTSNVANGAETSGRSTLIANLNLSVDTSQTLRYLGVRTLEEVASIEESELKRRLGEVETGRVLKLLQGASV